MKKISIILIIGLFLISIPIFASPDIENFTTYTEEDPNSRIEKTSSRITWTNLTADEAAYVYKDKGVNHFAADFEHLVTVNCVSGSGTNNQTAAWAVANNLNDWYSIGVAGQPGLNVALYYNGVNPRINLYEYNAGAFYSDTTPYLSLNTPYYLKIKRDENVGTYGTLYAYIYSDEARETLVDTLTLALHEKVDFRYIYGAQSADWNGATTETGYTEDLDLQEAAPPVVAEPQMEVMIIE